MQRQALETLKWREQEKTKMGVSTSATVCKRWEAATDGNLKPSPESIAIATATIVPCTTASAMHALSHPLAAVQACMIITHRSVSIANGIHTTTQKVPHESENVPEHARIAGAPGSGRSCP
eukprot:9484803-Pyramimonas_sp.AAC.1